MSLSDSRLRAALAGGAAASTLALFTLAGTGAMGTAGQGHARPQPATPFRLTHGETGLEGLATAAAEQYDNRAYPRQYIAPAQSKAARVGYADLPHGNGGKAGSGGTVTGGTGTGPSTGTSGWSELGPVNPVVSSELRYGGVLNSISGRTLAILVDPSGCTPAHCTVWVGTAGGGVWRTDNGLGDTGTQAWQPVNTGLTSNAVDALAMVNGVLYAGTGEPDGSNDSEAGTGLFRSTDGGGHWTVVPGSGNVAGDRALGAVWVDPANSGHIVIGTAAARHGASSVWGGRAFPPGAPTLGVYETTDGGSAWSAQQLPTTSDGAFLGGVTNLQKDPNSDDLYAGVVGYGLFRKHAGTWTQVFKSASSGQPGAGIGGGRVEFALANVGGTTVAYLGDSDTVGGSTVWKSSNVATASTNSGWTQLSSKNRNDPGYAVYGYCETQCGYDDFVVVNPGNPQELYVGGSMHYEELGPDYAGVPSPSLGRAVLHSTDGGATWTDVSRDATVVVDGQYSELHPDQHALAFGPNGAVFEANDGGVFRLDGPATDVTGECATRNLTSVQLAQCNQWLKAAPKRIVSLNDGLATVQFQSLSTNAAGDLLGGTQDNGTFAYSAGQPSSWFESIFGDGGQSGFDADQTTRYHTYYDATPEVNFHGTDPHGWDWIGDPLGKENQSFYSPFIADPTTHGYAFIGLQHVWRTTDNGGDPAYLDAHCNELNYVPAGVCGDWQALGGGGSGGNYYQGSAGDAGDLTGVYFGQDRKGEFVTQVERAPSDDHTMWAATRTGRVFVTTNAGERLPQNVRFTRIDNPSTPGRFVSGIFVDPLNPNHAWVSYSGYHAYAAGGHVYEVRFDPATGRATWTDLSYNLDSGGADIPITGIVATRSGDLYVGTDFGVAHLGAGAGEWSSTTDTLPIVSVFALLLSPDGGTLYAATHGRGAWKLPVS